MAVDLALYSSAHLLATARPLDQVWARFRGRGHPLDSHKFSEGGSLCMGRQYCKGLELVFRLLRPVGSAVDR